MKKTSYYRKITEALPQDFQKALGFHNIKKHSKHYTLLFLSISFLGLCLCVVLLYMSYWSLKEQWLKASDNFTYWEEVAKFAANSPDAYYQAGFYATELRNREKAIEYLDKAVSLDPSFEAARKLYQQLTKTTN